MQTYILSSLAVVMAAWMALPASAQDYPSLCVRDKEGNEYLYAADGFHLTYADGKVGISNFKSAATQPEEFSLASLESMSFSTVEVASVAVLPAGTADGRVEVYTMAGGYAGAFASLADARASLPKGFYIVKSASGINKTAL